MESIKINVNPKEYFSKMSADDATAITCMCLEKLCTKANELKDLYEQLSKTYSIEMGMSNITLLVQVSTPVLPVIPVRGSFGTLEGMKHALTVMVQQGVEDIANMEKEEEADENG